MKENFYLIEEVAQKTGLTKRTLRYYEEQGLLDAPTRTLKGYRLYAEKDFQRLSRIRELRESMGFTLTEVKEVLRLEDTVSELRKVYSRGEVPKSERETLQQLKDSLTDLLVLIARKKSKLEQIDLAYRDMIVGIDKHLNELE